jgi:hypothetical protein
MSSLDRDAFRFEPATNAMGCFVQGDVRGGVLAGEEVGAGESRDATTQDAYIVAGGCSVDTVVMAKMV